MKHFYTQTSAFILLLVFAFHSNYGQTFTEMAKSAGIIFQHNSSAYIGGGVAIFDYDNDGYEDIYLTGGQNTDRLYRNKGDGTFEHVSPQAGISAEATHASLAVTVGDIDNAGFKEIFVTRLNRQNTLYYNNGDGTFTDISATSKIDKKAYSLGAVFGDYNMDGLLDI